MERLLFTSESVTEGHPDKMCDQISDAILDALMEQDPMSRVACETCATTGIVMVMGEITTNAYVDIQKIVRDTVRQLPSERHMCQHQIRTFLLYNQFREQYHERFSEYLHMHL